MLYKAYYILADFMQRINSHFNTKIIADTHENIKKYSFITIIFLCFFYVAKRSLEIFSLLVIQCIKMNLGFKLLSFLSQSQNILNCCYNGAKESCH